MLRLNKTISVFLVIMLIFTLATPVMASVSAIDTDIVSEDGLVLYEYVSGELAVKAYTGSNKYIVIPESVNNMPVTCLESGVFDGIQNIRAFIPDTVTVIDEGVFSSGYVHIFYPGTSSQWKSSVEIGDNNDALYEGVRHYNTADPDTAYSTVVTTPTCIAGGFTTYTCTACDDSYIDNYTDCGSHKVSNGICEYCNEPFDVVESQHNYADNTDYTWTIQRAGATEITLVFSEDTEVEKNYDRIYIYDGSDTQIGKYTGTELASKSITVPGDTAKIRLVSDDGGNEYGFFALIVPAYPEATVPATEATTVPVATDAPEVTTDATEVTDKTITIYFTDMKYWGEAYVLTYGADGTLDGEWPGTAMTFVDNNDFGQDVYFVTIPANATGVVIHGGHGMPQTVEFTPADGMGYYCTTENSDGSWAVESYIHETTTPTTTENSQPELLDYLAVSCGDTYYRANIGDIITYTFTLTTPESIENVQAISYYNSDYLKIVPNDGADKFDPKVMFPVLREMSSVVYNTATPGIVKFNSFEGVDGGFDFTNGATLVTLQFEVIKNGNAGKIYTQLQEMDAFGGLDYIHKNVFLVDNIVCCETISGAEIMPEPPAQDPTEATTPPTATGAPEVTTTPEVTTVPETTSTTESTEVSIYTVTFVDWDGTLLKSEQVAFGLAATAPDAPTRESDSQYTYTFEGWDTDFDNITGDLTVTALYSRAPKPPTTGKLNIAVSGGTGFRISVNDGSASNQGTYYSNSSISIGAKVTVSAYSLGANEFIGWINPANGKVVSESLDYTFYASGNDLFVAMFKSVFENEKMVMFYFDKADQIWDVQYYSATDAIKFPEVNPESLGYEFKGWNMTEAEIKAEIAKGNDVTVLPVWEKVLVYVNITVNGGKVVGHGGMNDAGQYLAGGSTVVRADAAPAGQKFAYWVDGNGNIKSYSEEYKFYPSQSIELIAVYVDEDATIEYKTLVTVDTFTPGTYGSFTVSWYVPAEENNLTFVGGGIIAVNKDFYSESTFVHGTTDTNVWDRTGSTTATSNTYVWTGPVSSGQTWYAKAWVQYKDASGELVTVYSDMFEAYKD